VLLSWEDIDLDVCDIKGRTALFYAAGVDQTKENFDGEDALRAACKHRHYYVGNCILNVKYERNMPELCECIRREVLEDYLRQEWFQQHYGNSKQALAKLVIEMTGLTADESAVMEERDQQMVGPTGSELPSEQRYCARGAGEPSSTGVYAYHGIRDKSPVFRKEDHFGVFYLQKKQLKGRKKELWFLSRGSKPEKDMYYCRQSSDTVPTGRWDVVKNNSRRPSPHLDNGKFGEWFIAVEHQDIQRMAQLLNEGVNIDIPDRSGLTALHLAAKSGQHEAVRFLCESGCEVNMPDPRVEVYVRNIADPAHMRRRSSQRLRGSIPTNLEQEEKTKPIVKLKGEETALFHAVRHGRLRAFDELVANGADDEIKNCNGRSVLQVASKLAQCKPNVGIRECLTFIAAEKENLEEMKYALESAVDFSVRRSDGKMVLFHALAKQKWSVVNTILNRSISKVSTEVFIAFFKAQKTGDNRGIEQGVKAGIHVDLPSKTGKTALMTCALKNHKQAINALFKLNASLEAQDKDGRSTLALVTIKGNLELARALIKRGADINSQDKDGNTVLMLAVQSGKLHIVDEILRHEELDLERQNNKGRNIIFTIIQYKRMALISKFINPDLMSGLDDNLLKVVDVDGYSPLYYAATKNLISVVNILTKGGLRLSETEQRGLEARWFAACEEGEAKKIKCMILAGFDPNARERSGSTGLILAAKSGNEEAIFSLLRGVNNVINGQDEEGCTALHWAVASGELPIVEALVNSGANLSIVNDEGVTPLHLAESEGFEDIFHLLKGRGALYGDQVTGSGGGTSSRRSSLGRFSTTDLLEVINIGNDSMDEFTIA